MTIIHAKIRPTTTNFSNLYKSRNRPIRKTTLIDSSLNSFKNRTSSSRSNKIYTSVNKYQFISYIYIIFIIKIDIR